MRQKLPGSERIEEKKVLLDNCACFASRGKPRWDGAEAEG